MIVLGPSGLSRCRTPLMVEPDFLPQFTFTVALWAFTVNSIVQVSIRAQNVILPLICCIRNLRRDSRISNFPSSQNRIMVPAGMHGNMEYAKCLFSGTSRSPGGTWRTGAGQSLEYNQFQRGNPCSRCEGGNPGQSAFFAGRSTPFLILPAPTR